MAEAPSPYAPGIVSDERSPPRPPARPVVFLTATFVTMALMAGLWEVWRSRQSPDEDSVGRSFDLFTILSRAPGLLMLLWAYLSDRVALWGSRREGQVMLSGLMMAVVWVAIAAAQDYPMAWSVVALPIGLASVVARAATIGALAEIGRRRAATGWLAAANIGSGSLANYAAPWAMTSLAAVSIWAAAGAAVGSALALVMLIVTLSDDDAPTPAATAEARVGLPTFLRSRAFWALLPVLMCAGAATVPDTLISLRRAARNTGEAPAELQEWLRVATMIAVPIGYALLSRRLRFRSLLRFALLVQALVLVACGRLLGSSEPRAIDLAVLLLAVGDGLLGIAVLDLALRAAPPGREAFGAMLLIAVETVTRGLAGIAAFPLSKLVAVPLARSAVPMAWFGAGAAIVGLLAASLLPRAIAGTPDGPVVRSPP